VVTMGVPPPQEAGAPAQKLATLSGTNGAVERGDPKLNPAVSAFGHAAKGSVCARTNAPVPEPVRTFTAPPPPGPPPVSTARSALPSLLKLNSDIETGFAPTIEVTGG